MRLARVVDLINKSKMKADFERNVVADLPQRIERRVTEIIDWLVSSELRQWQAVTEHLALRRQQHADRIVGQVGRSFDFDRTRLLDSVGRAAQRSVETFDRERGGQPAGRLGAGGGRGHGAGRGGGDRPRRHAHPLAVTAAADFTGILAAGTIAVLGFFIIPNRRRDAKKDLREKIEAMREQLMDVADRPVRPRDRGQPAADRRGDRPLHPLRPRRARAPAPRPARSSTPSTRGWCGCGRGWRGCRARPTRPLNSGPICPSNPHPRSFSTSWRGESLAQGYGLINGPSLSPRERDRVS